MSEEVLIIASALKKKKKKNNFPDKPNQLFKNSFV